LAAAPLNQQRYNHPGKRMIDFPCTCGHLFSVPQDLAGGLIQCPKCKRLNDVPRLGELSDLDEKGMYKIGPDPSKKPDPQGIAEMATVFTRDHFDATGAPIDNRGKYTPVPLAGDKFIPPKYDPFTGELVREVEIKPESAPAPEPVPTLRPAPLPPPTIVNGMDVPTPFELFALPWKLLTPINLIVMVFILLAHVLGQFMMMAIASFYFLLIPFWAVLQLLMLSHFGNVIDETGPESRQELPTPLRSMSWHEDTFGPLSRVVVALLVCYGPAAMMLMSIRQNPLPVALAISAILGLAGTVLFPAAVLTAITSGSVLNQRPDRLVRTAFVCGIEYLPTMFVWVLGGTFYVGGIIGINWLGAAVLAQQYQTPAYVTWYSAYGALVLGIYLLHLLGWHLGTLYRKHHQHFPWAYQRREGGLPAEPTGFPVTRRRRRQAFKPSAPPAQNDARNDGSIAHT
jgi:hypothetical protein